MKNKKNKGRIRRHNIWEIVIKGLKWKEKKLIKKPRTKIKNQENKY
jgi:hypothetical protein